MSVYVDASIYGYGRMVMCHMIADTPEELHAMADRIGIARKWFQDPAKGRVSFWHYDIAKSKRSLAVEAGALECNRNAFVTAVRRIRASGVFQSVALAVHRSDHGDSTAPPDKQPGKRGAD